MSPQAQIHNAIKKFLSKRQQGIVMGEIRKFLPKPVEYDRELIAEMLDAYVKHNWCRLDLEHLESSIEEQARLLRAADERDAAGVHTAKAEPYPPTEHSA